MLNYTIVPPLILLLLHVVGREADRHPATIRQFFLSVIFRLLVSMSSEVRRRMSIPAVLPRQVNSLFLYFSLNCI